MYARAGNILLSLLGPAYFGLMHSPYVVLVVWSAACAAIELDKPRLVGMKGEPEAREPCLEIGKEPLCLVTHGTRTYFSLPFLLAHQIITPSHSNPTG
jgi:hypothetical protein